MFKRFKLPFALIVLSLSIQNAQANFEEEFDYYLECGFHSPRFYDNILEGRDDATSVKISKLQDQEERRKYWTREERQEFAETWYGLSQGEGDSASSILFLGKSLNTLWQGYLAQELSEKCHKYLQDQDDSTTQTLVAYRGFKTLQVNLTEPGYDLHTKLAAVPQVLTLLEDLKVSCKSVMDLPGHFKYEAVFPEHCIPRAQVCALLMPAYGAALQLDSSDYETARRAILENGLSAIQLYEQGLEGPTTPKQREFYHKQIINLVLGLNERVPQLLDAQVTQRNTNLKQKSAMALARILKEGIESEKSTVDNCENKGPYENCLLTYRAALAYFHAGKTASALKYIRRVSEFPSENTQEGLFIDNVKIRAENLRLQIEEPCKVLSHQYQHSDIFAGVY